MSEDGGTNCGCTVHNRHARRHWLRHRRALQRRPDRHMSHLRVVHATMLAQIYDAGVTPIFLFHSILSRSAQVRGWLVHRTVSRLQAGDGSDAFFEDPRSLKVPCLSIFFLCREVHTVDCSGLQRVPASRVSYRGSKIEYEEHDHGQFHVCILLWWYKVRCVICSDGQSMTA